MPSASLSVSDLLNISYLGESESELSPPSIEKKCRMPWKQRLPWHCWVWWAWHERKCTYEETTSRRVPLHTANSYIAASTAPQRDHHSNSALDLPLERVTRTLTLSLEHTCSIKEQESCSDSATGIHHYISEEVHIWKQYFLSLCVVLTLPCKENTHSYLMNAHPLPIKKWVFFFF